MAEKITDEDLLREAAWGDADGFETVQTKIIDHRRWSVTMETVFRRQSDGKLFAMYWDRGATESQDNEYAIEALEVEAVEVTVIEYQVVA